MITIIESDGTKRTVIGNSLEDVQGYVGGFVEEIPAFVSYEGETCQAYCNEEGKLESLPYNKTATDAWWKQLPEDPLLRPWIGIGVLDFLVGPIVILTGDDLWD